MSSPKEKARGLDNQPGGQNDICDADFTKLAQVLAPIAEAQTFLAWKPGPVKPDGKFDKIPIGANGRTLKGWQKSEKHLTLEAAIARAKAHGNLNAGVGVAFTGEPVAEDAAGRPLYLVALDLDNVFVNGELIPTAEEIVRQMASYTEGSPSGKGSRTLAYSREPFGTTRPDKFETDGVKVGFELFASSGFVTLTGNAINDLPIKIRTNAIRAYDDRWLAGKAKPRVRRGEVDINRTLGTVLNRATAVSESVAAAPFVDTEKYDDYKDVMMAVAALRPLVGDDVADGLAITLANNAPELSKLKNDAQAYDPLAFSAVAADMPPESGLAILKARAKAKTVALLEDERGRSQLSEIGRMAARYLALAHHATYQRMIGGAK